MADLYGIHEALWTLKNYISPAKWQGKWQEIQVLKTKQNKTTLQAAASDPYLYVTASPCRAANPAVSSLRFIFQDCFSSVNVQWSYLFVRDALQLLVWSFLCDDYMKHQLRYLLNPDSAPNIFPNLISLQCFQLEYFYFFSCPVKFEGSLCWRKCVSALQCWMNGTCIWPNFLIRVVKIISKIITHLPKYCTDYGHQSTQLWTGMH